MKKYVLPASLVVAVLAAAAGGAVWYYGGQEEEIANESCSSCTLRHQNLRNRLGD